MLAGADADASDDGNPALGRGNAERRTWTTVRGDGGPLDRPDPMRLRGFIPIEELESSARPDAAVAPEPRTSRRKPTPVAAPPVKRADRPLPVDDWETRVSLFGEADL